MKIHSFLLFAATLLLICAPLHGATAPKLETLLSEYKQARAQVLGKLNEVYATQADALAQQFQAVPNLDGADRARRFAKRLRDPDERNDAYGPTGKEAAADPLAELQANYAHAREENLNNVYAFYATAAANLRRELLQANDQAGAKVLTEFLEKIKPAKAVAAQATPARPGTLSSK